MACRLWRDSRTPELSPARVAAIMSHIGSAQDAAAWVMLASLSEFVDIANPQPIMDHYLNVITMVGSYVFDILPSRIARKNAFMQSLCFDIFNPMILEVLG